MATLHLGSETDATARRRLKAALRAVNAKKLSNSWGVFGSQEVVGHDYRIGSSIVRVEAETDMGISVSGDDAAVSMLASHLSD
jgi:hypothetical protein